MDFRGSYTVSVTPFTAGGSTIDFDAQRRFIDWQLKCGVPGLIIFGSTGEFLTVSDAERTALVQATVEHVAGRIPVLVGTMNAYTPTAVRYSREAQELGADGLMIAPPYYYTPTEDEIFRYYAAICDAVDLPIMVYNNPVTTNVDIPAALVAKMTAELPNIRYIKEASLDVGRVYDIVQATGGVMSVFAGSGSSSRFCSAPSATSTRTATTRRAPRRSSGTCSPRGGSRRQRRSSTSSTQSTTSSPPATRHTATSAIPRHWPPSPACRWATCGRR
jgi:dihydrodipicolinate synthase/N-acetylneuraminate lyase